ncbi:hypothetical protein FRC20_002779 [Serendipita sp. 405]|nr:hypothetical protein FRC20_002779 [Serendipita sp. 405]
MHKYLATLVLSAISLSLTASAQPILSAPVNTPTLIQTFMVNSRFAPCLQAAGNYDGAPVNTATRCSRGSWQLRRSDHANSYIW